MTALTRIWVWTFDEDDDLNAFSSAVLALYAPFYHVGASTSVFLEGSDENQYYIKKVTSENRDKFA